MIVCSITGLFKVFIYLIFIYFVVRLFTRLLIPVAMEDYVEKAKKKADKERKAFFQEAKKKEGKVSIDYVPPVEKKFTSKDGDYIDYEELK
jgi:hypothetical protein